MTDDDDEYRALLRAVLEQPEDDTARLILADWLEETCEMSNVIRAKFIRLSIETYRHDVSGLQNDDGHLMNMLERCGLIWTHGEDWFGERLFHQCRIKKGPDGGVPNAGKARRGFVDRIECTLAEFMGFGKCRSCDGDGRTVDDTAGRWSKCQPCKGTGVSPGLVDTIFAEQPVTDVLLTDREPYEMLSSLRTEYVWIRGYGSAVLPDLIHMYLRVNPDTPSWISYPTRQDALAALSAACVALGRTSAGLGVLAKAKVP